MTLSYLDTQVNVDLKTFSKTFLCSFRDGYADNKSFIQQTFVT